MHNILWVSVISRNSVYLRNITRNLSVPIHRWLISWRFECHIKERRPRTAPNPFRSNSSECDRVHYSGSSEYYYSADWMTRRLAHDNNLCGLCGCLLNATAPFGWYLFTGTVTGYGTVRASASFLINNYFYKNHRKWLCGGGLITAYKRGSRASDSWPKVIHSPGNRYNSSTV